VALGRKISEEAWECDKPKDLEKMISRSDHAKSTERGRTQ